MRYVSDLFPVKLKRPGHIREETFQLARLVADTQEELLHEMDVLGISRSFFYAEPFPHALLVSAARRRALARGAQRVPKKATA